MNRFTKEQMKEVVESCEANAPKQTCRCCACTEGECASYLIAHLIKKHGIKSEEIEDAIEEIEA